MKSKSDFDKICLYCEYSEPLYESEFCICSKKGAVEKNDCCRKFSLDLIKMPAGDKNTDYLK